MPTLSESARKTFTVTRDAPPPHTTPPAAGTLVVEEPRFAIVPEWVLDAAVSDFAFRLYSLLLRYGNGSGSRMPSRQTLAQRLRRSVDAIDRAMRQLAEMEARLAETEGRWPALQAQARAELTAEACPSFEAPSRTVPAQSSTSTSCNERRTAHSTPLRGEPKVPPYGLTRISGPSALQAQPDAWSFLLMVSPNRGWLRGLRAALLGVVGFVVALVAHVSAGGAAPGPVVLIPLAGLTGLAAVLLTAVRQTPLRIGVSLVAMQVVLHEAFGWLGAPVDCATTSVSAAGATPMSGQGRQSALACATAMASAGMGQGSVFGTAAMLGAHIAATAVMAALLAYGEEVLWLLARWVRPASWLRARLPLLPTMHAVPYTAAPMVRLRLACGGVGRRGPPPRALSAIV